MHNLGTVFNFELVRTLKKKSFWIAALSFPVIFAAVFAIIFFSNKSTAERAEQAQNEKITLAITDESKLISPQLLKKFNGKTLESKQQGIDDVKSGELDAYFYYPAELEKNRVEVYGKDVSLFDNNRYQAIAETLMQQSASSRVSPELQAVLQKQVGLDTTFFRDGTEYNGFQQMIAPAIFLVLFYAVIVMFGSQMLTSTTEEKENRVIEMILTTIEARTLIIGKILSLIVLALIQMALIVIPALVVYFGFGNQLSLPSLDIASLPIDPTRMLIGGLIFVFSFLLFTGLLVAIGAAVPTAKEANSFFGVVMILLFGPLYAFSLFISSPDSPLVVGLSMFPFTAPIPLLLRNAVGNLPASEALVGIAILAIASIIVMFIAVRLFRYGALEYSSRVRLSTILGSGKK